MKLNPSEIENKQNLFREKFKSLFGSVPNFLSPEKQTIFYKNEKKINSRRHNDVFIYLQIFHQKYKGASAIAAYLGRSKSSIIRSIHNLIDSGMISVSDLVYVKEFKRFQPFEFHGCNELNERRFKKQTSKKRIYYQFKNFNKIDLKIAEYFRRKKSGTYIPTVSSKRARTRSARSIKYEQMRECGSVIMSVSEWERKIDDLTNLKKSMNQDIDRCPESRGINEWYIDNVDRIAPQTICEPECPQMICENESHKKNIFLVTQTDKSSVIDQTSESTEMQCESSQDEYEMLKAYRDKYRAEATARIQEESQTALEFLRDKYKAAVVATSHNKIEELNYGRFYEILRKA